MGGLDQAVGDAAHGGNDDHDGPLRGSGLNDGGGAADAVGIADGGAAEFHDAGEKESFVWPLYFRRVSGLRDCEDGCVRDVKAWVQRPRRSALAWI